MLFRTRAPPALQALKHTIGLRVHKEVEEEGLDISVHGEKIVFFGASEPVKVTGPGALLFCCRY